MSEQLPPVSPTIEMSISAFLQDVAIGHSPATVRTYANGLSRFCRYLLSHHLCQPAQTATATLQTDWAINFVRDLATDTADPTTGKVTTKASKATLATYAAALTRFYNWAGTERHLSLPADDYARLIKRLRELRGKNQRTIINKVPADEVLEKLLAQVRIEKSPPTSSGGLAAYDKSRHELLRLRNIALLETLKSSGARVSEICQLKRVDLDHTNQRARVIGKGNKERWIYFSPTAWQTVQAYLNARSKQLAKKAEGEKGPPRRERASQLEEQPVFCRHDRGAGSKSLKPLSTRAIENMLWEVVEEAELQTHITPHKFRHWFATRVLAATGDLATTQDLLGHASPTTTRIYAQVSEHKKQATHRQVFT